MSWWDCWVWLCGYARWSEYGLEKTLCNVTHFMPWMCLWQIWQSIFFIFFFFFFSYKLCDYVIFPIVHLISICEPQLEKTYLLTCAPNEDTNQPAHLCCLIRYFVVRMKKPCILCFPNCAQRRFWSDCANAQSDLNLRWAHISESTFSDVVDHI